MVFVCCTGFIVCATIALKAFDFARHSVTEVFVVGVAVILVIQVCLWALLQFRWLIYAFPPICLANERVLFVTVPLSTASMLLWWCLSTEQFAIEHMPLAYAVILCVQHAIFGSWLPSSYRGATVAAASVDDADDFACTVIDSLWQVKIKFCFGSSTFFC